METRKSATTPTTRQQGPSHAAGISLPQVLMQMVTGGQVAQAVFVAAKLGIADLLKDGPKSVDELAQATETHAPSLYRLLRALSSLGMFAESGQRYFELTPLAELLRSGGPRSLRSLALLSVDPSQWAAWGDLLHSIQTGEGAFFHHFGMPLWEYLAQHSDTGKIFHDAMSNLSVSETMVALAAYDFSASRVIVDVAGGTGKFLTAILQRYPSLRGILFDLPSVVQTAAHQDPQLTEERCSVVGGDMLVSVPSGGDTYIIKSVVHNLDNEQAITLLRNCAQVMPAHGRLLLIENVITPGNTPDFSKLMDLNMLVALGGRERTAQEFTALLTEAGLELLRIIPLQLYSLSILEVKKAVAS